MHGTSILQSFLDCSCKTSSRVSMRYGIFRFKELCFGLPAASRPSRSCICQFGRPSTIRPSPFHPSLIQACCHSAISEFTRPRNILDFFSTLDPLDKKVLIGPCWGAPRTGRERVQQPSIMHPRRRMLGQRRPAGDLDTKLWVYFVVLFHSLKALRTTGFVANCSG